MTDLNSIQSDLEYSRIMFKSQRDLEEESLESGSRKYLKGIERTGISSTKGGVEQTKRSLEVLAQAIESWKDDCHKGKAGRLHSAYAFIAHVDPEQLAYLAIRHGLDAAYRELLFASAAIDLGTSVQDHVSMLWLEEHDSKAHKWLVERLKSSTSERHRIRSMRFIVRKERRKAVNEASAAALDWTEEAKVHVGGKLLELFEETLQVIQKKTITEGYSDKVVRIMFHEEAKVADWIAGANLEDFPPVHMPMVVAPRSWVVVEKEREDGTKRYGIEGGYRTPAMWSRAPLMKRARDVAMHLYMGHGAEDVIGRVNKIQATAWQVNPRVLEVMLEARKMPALDHMFESEEVEVPKRPTWLDEEGLPKDKKLWPEARQVEFKEWKAKASNAHETNNRAKGSKVESKAILALANKFGGFPRIWFPHQLDFRGRIYPFAAFLQPQGGDQAKGLLRFATGKPLRDDRGFMWLQIHVANTFGKDKESYTDRVMWTEMNRELILSTADQPLDDLRWTESDSPWCFLAACSELAAAWRSANPYEFVSHLPIAQDGTCSGIQHFAGMLRDPVSGAHVNLVPGLDKPGDIYSRVAEAAQALSNSYLDGSTSGKDDDTEEDKAHRLAMAYAWVGKVNRKVAKPPTMTRCYGSTVIGVQKQIQKTIRKDLKTEQRPQADAKDASMYMAGVVREAMDGVVRAAKVGMDFLRDCSKVMCKAEKPISWTTPSGFYVIQAYKKVTSKVIKLSYRGQELKVSIAIREEKELNDNEQRAGLAPNFVHSLDSSHLMAVVGRGTELGIDSWACIHDSIGVHACDTDTLHQVIRETFVEQYRPDVLAKFREELVVQLAATHPKLVAELPAVPAKGTLDIEEVIHADYFFA